MPKVVDAARATIRDGVLWRVCPARGQPPPMAPEALFCDTRAHPPRDRRGGGGGVPGWDPARGVAPGGVFRRPRRNPPRRWGGGVGARGGSPRRTVTLLAGPGIYAARHVYTHVPADAIRVAALVEIAAAAA